jgi:hypothetical protein
MRNHDRWLIGLGVVPSSWVALVGSGFEGAARALNDLPCKNVVGSSAWFCAGFLGSVRCFNVKVSLRTTKTSLAES